MDGIMETESIASRRSSERRDSVESSLSAKGSFKKYVTVEGWGGMRQFCDKLLRKM